MTKITGYTQPPLDRALEHHGVLGMKWGHRKAQDGGSGGSSSKPAKPAKPTSADIHAARIRQEARINKLNYLADEHALATSEKGRKAIEKQIGKVSGDLLRDEKLAAKSTTGEKWLMGAAWGVFAATSIASIGLAASGSRRL